MKLFRMFAVLLAVVCMTFGGKALAAEDGMQVFQDAYLPAMDKAQNYHLELIFHGPTFQSNLVASGQIGMGGSGVVDGTLSWAYTNTDTNQTKQNEIPIYAERSGNSIVLYGQRNGSWQRENVLEGLAWILDAVSANDRATRMQYAAAVKDVTATDVGNGRQSMRILLDGKALAEMARGKRHVLVAEINAGQMVQDVRLAVEGRTPVSHFGRLGGIVPEPAEIVDELKAKLKQHDN